MDRRIKQSTNLSAWLAGKTADDLQAIRRGRRVLYPDAIVFYDERMEPHDEPILIRVPDKEDVLAGRVDAILNVAKRVPKGMDFKVSSVDDARKFIGADQFDELENIAICARCMYDPTPGEGDKLPPQFKRLDLLITDHSPAAIIDVWDRMNVLAREVAPRFDELTESHMWLAAEFIARTENASPLAAMRAGTQRDFLIWLCKLAAQAKSSSSSP